jgi:hypothetical protein
MSRDWFNVDNWDSYAEGTGSDYLDGLATPFAKKCEDFLTELGTDCIPLYGHKNQTEYDQMYTDLHGPYGKLVDTLMDPPDTSSIPFGLGMMVTYRSVDAKDKALELASQHGIAIDPNVPHVWEPLGLRLPQTPWEFSPVDTGRFQKREGKADVGDALNDAFEYVLGSAHYANPELRHAWRSRPESDMPEFEPAGHTSDSMNPEGYLWHPDFGGITSPLPSGTNFLTGEGEWNKNSSMMKQKIRKTLLSALEGQESDHGENSKTYTGGHRGLLQWSQSTWDSYVNGNEYNDSIVYLDRNPQDADLDWKWAHAGNEEEQKLLGNFVIDELLNKYDGDVGAVIMDHGGGSDAVREDYWPQVENNRMIGDNLTSHQYLAEVARVFWYMMNGNPYQATEEVRDQGLGPYQFDNTGQMILQNPRGFWEN